MVFEQKTTPVFYSGTKSVLLALVIGIVSAAIFLTIVAPIVGQDKVQSVFGPVPSVGEAFKVQALPSCPPYSKTCPSNSVPTSNAVISLSLINATSDLVIQPDPMTNDLIINTANTGTALNIRANTTSDVTSVRFNLDNGSYTRDEGSAPFALFGDSSGDFRAGSFSNGIHSLTVTPFVGSTAGIPLTVRFSVQAGTVVCGDGQIGGSEQCDQGNGNVANGDGCSSLCRTESNWTCIGEPSVCTQNQVPVCGNTVIETGELCDNTNLNNQTCISQGFNGGTLRCNSTCTGFNFSQCTGNQTGVTLVGAGDIAGSGNNNAGAILTSALLTNLLSNHPNPTASNFAIFTTGDNAYGQGTPAQFEAYYAPTWGQPALKAKTIFPVPGNHEYYTANASGYFDYFGNAARGPNGEPYYVKEFGGWRIYGLNSQLNYDGSQPMINWLREDLRAHPTRCVMAIWHEPRFTSVEGRENRSGEVNALWEVLYEEGADVILNGHAHVYERFARQRVNPNDRYGNGLADPNGIREFIIGTGGYAPHDLVPGKPNVEAQVTDVYGVVEFTLRPDGYDWRFHPAEGYTFTDSGSENCVE